MMKRRFGLTGVLALSLALGGAACSEDDADDGTSEGSTDDASTSNDASSGGNGNDAGGDAGRDASSSTPDSGGGSNGNDAGGRDASSTNDSGPSGGDSGSGDGGTAAQDIVALAVADGRFTTLAKALTDTGLVPTLQGAGPFTVFAPTDAAFMALGQATLNSLTPAQLKTILEYHVLASQVLSTQLMAGPVKTVSGISAFVSTTGGAKVNGATVTTADVRASNGVIHVVDKVLLPPDIVQAAQYAGSFTKLAAALTRANLVETVQTTQNITVFAPTDAAFTALGDATVNGLTVAQLGDVLKYHVVGQRVLSTQLTAGAIPTLLTGKSLTISLTGGVKVNDANVAVADVVATNGVIHVIDKVLLPPM